MLTETSAELFEHGIQNENSDVRAHVCPMAKTVYVFRTKFALPIMEKFREGRASQPGVNGQITGVGRCVPVDAIPDVRKLAYRSRPWWDEFVPNLSTSVKGKLAIAVVIELLRLGRFPLWIYDGQESDSTKLQILGTDLLVYHKSRIQVKCDLAGGVGIGCTGNLFLQTAERNPLRLH